MDRIHEDAVERGDEILHDGRLCIPALTMLSVFLEAAAPVSLSTTTDLPAHAGWPLTR